MKVGQLAEACCDRWCLCTATVRKQLMTLFRLAVSQQGSTSSVCRNTSLRLIVLTPVEIPTDADQPADADLSKQSKHSENTTW